MTDEARKAIRNAALEALFDQEGPQIAPKEDGREPSLREMMVGYYTAHGIPFAKAKTLTAKYIRALKSTPTAPVKIPQDKPECRFREEDGNMADRVRRCVTCGAYGDTSCLLSTVKTAPQNVPDDVVRDAERYRWLRDVVPATGRPGIYLHSYDGYHTYVAGPERDQYIDAAISQPTAQGEKE